MNDWEYQLTILLEMWIIWVRERKRSHATRLWEKGKCVVSKIRRTVNMKMAVEDSNRCNIAVMKKRLRIFSRRDC